MIADLDTLLTALYGELTDRIIPVLSFGRPGPGKPPEVTGAELACLADHTPGSAELLRVMDAMLVPCGRSAVTAKRSDLYGWAGCGYCPSHSR